MRGSCLGVTEWRWLLKGALLTLFTQLSAQVSFAQRALRSAEPWRSPEWWAALHYRPTWTGGVLSEVVSPDFFFAEGGATDPQAEWEASIELLKVALTSPRALQSLCVRPDRFLVIARALGEEVQLDALMRERCPEHDEWAGLAAQGLAWTHSGASFTRPESSLGHASLWLKSARGLEHALTFGAHLNGPFDRLWALLGTATGDWTLKPYRGFERVYRELEERDLTRITLSERPQGGGSVNARRMLGLHLKSLRGVSLRYSFMGNNCATQSARLLDISASLAGERSSHPRPERWGLSPLEAAEERLSFALSLERHPSLIEELISLSQQLSPPERQERSALFSQVQAWLSSQRASLPSPREGGSKSAWRAAMLTFDVTYAPLLSTPPREDAQDHKARVWEARESLLLGLSELSTRDQLSGVTSAPLPSAPPTLTPPDRLYLQLTAPLHGLTSPRLYQRLHWGLSLWSEPLSTPHGSPGRRLFLLGPALWGAGLRPPEGGRLISLWSLGALNSPVPRLSWTIETGAGAHERSATSDLAWARGELGGGVRSVTLNARAWLHLGLRASLAKDLTGQLSPYLSLGGRGALTSWLGWSLITRGGLPSMFSAHPTARVAPWLNPEPLSARLTLRAALVDGLRLLCEARARPLDDTSRLGAWVGIEL